MVVSGNHLKSEKFVFTLVLIDLSSLKNSRIRNTTRGACKGNRCISYSTAADIDQFPRICYRNQHASPSEHITICKNESQRQF